MSKSMQLRYQFQSSGVFINRFIFRPNFARMRLSWECHDQSQETNIPHCVNGPGLPFCFHKRNGVLKIDQSVKVPSKKAWYGICMPLIIDSCPHPWVPDIYFRNHFFFSQADIYNCGCVQGFECKPAGFGRYWGKCVEESGSGMGANVIS